MYHTLVQLLTQHVQPSGGDDTEADVQHSSFRVRASFTTVASFKLLMVQNFRRTSHEVTDGVSLRDVSANVSRVCSTYLV